ncbi:hypothetical protein PILCRDRAFT_95026 [Piloderma croceum F 1598]|uniref:Survival protein SurE-like phosphatase/nucleotidase domain-containing protein n=1 Tax=Piloderma croceum (strain F 1598) TaxID=765440 RepID=A0A0C3G128_PILCF|nr:hypothetical protein PILCRDRAFT_95026 [Piloderma croceum F 1598]
MPLSYKIIPVLLVIFLTSSVPVNADFSKILLTNDDGWAVAQIRAQRDALTKAGFDVILSAPAENESGTGSSTKTPTTLTQPCEYDTCATGSPAEGFNQSDPFLNYVNAFPVDSVKYGIQSLAPKLFDGSKPDFVVSGPNVGNNVGTTTLISGTVGAACEAALEGIPSAAFSGDSTAQVSYTTLDSDPTSKASLAASIYASLTVKFVQALLGNSTSSILPKGISLNVNYPATDNCADATDFHFVLSRIESNTGATDVQTCGSHNLPSETSVIDTSGCYSSVSVFNASTKSDVDAATQAVVLNKLSGILTCLPS